jgi:hypothetical protein
MARLIRKDWRTEVGKNMGQHHIGCEENEQG